MSSDFISLHSKTLKERKKTRKWKLQIDLTFWLIEKNNSQTSQYVSIDFFIAVQWNFKTNDERDPAQVIFTQVQVSVLKR